MFEQDAYYKGLCWLMELSGCKKTPGILLNDDNTMHIDGSGMKKIASNIFNI